MKKNLIVGTVFVLIFSTMFVGCSGDNDLERLESKIENANPQEVDVNALQEIIYKFHYADKKFLEGEDISLTSDSIKREIENSINFKNVPDEVEAKTNIYLFEGEMGISVLSLNYAQAEMDYLEGKIIEAEYEEEIKNIQEEYKEIREKTIKQIEKLLENPEEKLKESEEG